MLKIENLNKSFNNKKILDGLSFEIAPGEIAILLGESGGGKSTLLRILAHLEKQDSGNTYLNKQDLKSEIANKKHLVGMIFQNFNLFEHMSVLKNLTFVIEKVEKKPVQEAKKIALEFLKQYNLTDVQHEYPSNLSGGQKQRLAIARSLALNPQIMCFDEPTSALDPSLTKLVAENISKLAQKHLIILVATHDMSLLEKLSATIYLMKNGKIVEKCTTKDFYLEQAKYPLIKNFIQGH